MNNLRKATLLTDEFMVTEADKNTESVNLIPMFATFMGNVKNNNTQIRNLMVEQSKSNGGITIEKSLSHTDLVNYVIMFTGAIHTYAVNTNDSYFL